jgi:hypothetical protein
VALWSRLDRFDPAILSTAIEERRAVRMPLFRATLHLVTREDALLLRPVVHPVLHGGFYSGSPFGRNLEGRDVAAVLAEGRRLLEEAPRTRAELQPLLVERFPDHDAPSLAYACTYLLPTVQVTPRGLWGRSGRSAFTTLESWAGAPMATADAPDDLVMRYLKVFGPATPGDLRAWSGLAGAAEIIERLRPKLRTFRDEQGRELVDAPRAPLPDPETPAPVRFLPEFDNVVLGHDDRSRIVAADTKLWAEVGWGTVLVDGFTAARWRAFLGDGRLRIDGFRKLARFERAEIEAEGHRLLAFLADGSGGEVEILSP